MPILVFAFIFVEIAILLRLGLAVGGAWIFAEVLLSGVLGYVVLRAARKTALRTEELIQLLLRPGAYLRRSEWALVLAGILLIVPGILTDIAAVALIFRHFTERRRPPQNQGPSRREPDVIDVEYKVHDDDPQG